jgi:hypothetical protein
MHRLARSVPLGVLAAGWRASVAPPAAGAVLLRVRATDGTGALQAATPEPPLPLSAAGWQRVRVIAG